MKLIKKRFKLIILGIISLLMPIVFAACYGVPYTTATTENNNGNVSGLALQQDASQDINTAINE